MNWKTSESHPLRIAEVDLGEHQKLGLSFCPGKTQPNAMSGPWKRDLETDLFRIRSKGYEVVVSLIEGHEFVELEVEEMRKGAVENAEMKWIWVPIVDGDVPTEANDDGLNEVVNSLISGESVFVHCKGGLGRAGTVSAWLLTHFGRTAQEAISEVREVRDKALENQGQENWVNAHATMFLGRD